MATYTNIPATSSGGGAGTAGVAFTRAQALLGSTATGVEGTEFDNDQWHVSVPTGAGTGAVSQTAKNGVYVLSSSASPLAACIVRPHGSTSHIDNIKTTPWYCVWRAKVATATDAVTSAHGMIAGAAGSGNPNIYLGVIGAESAANYSYQYYNNAGVLVGHGASSVAIDTNYHTFEIWNDLTNTNFAIDGTSFATVTNALSGTSPCSIQAYCGNGGTAADRQFHIDYMWCVTVPN